MFWVIARDVLVVTYAVLLMIRYTFREPYLGHPSLALAVALDEGTVERRVRFISALLRAFALSIGWLAPR